MDDIMIYYARGYGAPSLNENFGNRLIGDLMTKLKYVNSIPLAYISMYCDDRSQT